MINTFKIAATALALAFASSAVSAATLATYTHDYGSGAGKVDPGGSDALGADFVTVSDGSDSRFFDSFDFSSLAYEAISSFDLTLTFADAGPRGAFNLLENWSVRIQGSNSSGVADDLFVGLSDELSPQSVTVSMSTDTDGFPFFGIPGVDAFAHSVATETFEFWFSEFTTSIFSDDEFNLDSASLAIIGTPAAVPLPAGFPMLLLGLGGVAALRRRKRA